MPKALEQTTLAELTAEIVSAYVAHNQITPSDLGTLVGAVASQLRAIGTRVEQGAQRIHRLIDLLEQIRDRGRQATQGPG